MQPQGAILQQAGSAPNRGHFKRAQGLAGKPLAAHSHAGACQQLSGAWSSQPMADVPSREPFHHPLQSKARIVIICRFLSGFLRFSSFLTAWDGIGYQINGQTRTDSQMIELYGGMNQSDVMLLEIS